MARRCKFINKTFILYVLMFLLAYFLLTGCQEGVTTSKGYEVVGPKATNKKAPVSAAVRRKYQRPHKMKKKVIVPTFRAIAWPTDSSQL